MFKATYFVLLGCVCTIAIGQVLFKMASSAITLDRGRSILANLSLNVTPLLLVTAAVVLYVISTVGWIHSLRTIPLSIAFLFNLLAFILVPAAGYILFNEPVPRLIVPGAAAILIGLLLLLVP
jgi:drug/metabolite transporter (DMT)-like permease